MERQKKAEILERKWGEREEKRMGKGKQSFMKSFVIWSKNKEFSNSESINDEYGGTFSLVKYEEDCSLDGVHQKT